MAIVVMDPTIGAQRFWERPKTGVSKMAGVLFEIAAQLDGQKEDLVIGFLGHSHFYPLDAACPAEAIEEQIQIERARSKPQMSGRLFAPVYSGLAKHFATRQKRIVVICQSDVPDLRDRPDLRATCLRLAPDSRDDFWEGERPQALFPDGETLDKGLVKRHVLRQQGTINSVEIRFGQCLPFQWIPEDGEFDKDGEEFVVRWRVDHRMSVRLWTRMASSIPSALRNAVGLNKDGQSIVQFDEPLLKGTGEEVESVQSDALTDPDFDLWRAICALRCPHCDHPEVHLLHPGTKGFKDQLVFQSVAPAARGFLAIQDGAREWRLFQTGLKLGPWTVVVRHGVLWVQSPAGDFAEIEQIGSVYKLRSDDAVWYMTRV